ncbi:MAG: hypothetical protein IJE01_01745 [Clostridia bacterium]|nr:hypothetical protein [Clostridia bacterium]
MENYLKIANKLLRGISDPEFLKPEIWNDIVAKVKAEELQLWEINNEILRLKYFHADIIALASSFACTDKSHVRFENMNDYFVHTLTEKDSGYFVAFLDFYDNKINGLAAKYVNNYSLEQSAAEDIKQIFISTLWELLLAYDPADQYPLLHYEKFAVYKQVIKYIRTVKAGCTVPSHNGYMELKKVLGIYNDNPQLPTDERIALIVKETGFDEEKVAELIAIGKATEYPIGIVPTEDDEGELDGAISDELIEDPSVSLFRETWRSICREHFSDAAESLMPKDKQIISLSLGVCFDCFGIFEPNSYAEISLKQGASGEKSIEKKRKTAIEKFAKDLCIMGFCDGITLKQKNKVIVTEDGEKKVQSVTYEYTPFEYDYNGLEGYYGEVIFFPEAEEKCYIINLAEFDATGAYAEQAARIIRCMNGGYVKQKFYAIPLERLPNVCKDNAEPKLPFYEEPRTIEQK